MQINFAWDCCGQQCRWVEVSVLVRVSVPARMGQCACMIPCVCANVLHVCRQSMGIHLRMRSFYLSRTVIAAIHTFYITVLLELRIGVWDLMSFISEPLLAAAFQTSHVIKHHLLQMLLSRPQHLISHCSNTESGLLIIWGFFIDFSLAFKMLRDEENTKRAYLSVRLLKILSKRQKHLECNWWLWRRVYAFI